MRGGALKDMDRVVAASWAGGAVPRSQDIFHLPTFFRTAAQSVALGQPPHAEEGSDWTHI